MGWSRDGNKDGESEEAGMHTDGVHVVSTESPHSCHPEVGCLIPRVDVICGLSLLLALISLLLREFFSRFVHKNQQIVKFQFDQVMSVSPNSRVLVPGYKM